LRVSMKMKSMVAREQPADVMLQLSQMCCNFPQDRQRFPKKEDELGNTLGG